MTLHTYPDVEQGSESWHDLRRGIVTASTVGKLLTPTLKVADNDTSRALTLTLAAERISGYTDDGPMTSDMWRGREMEPYARDIYSGHYQQASEFGFLLREEDDWSLGLSPDGLVADEGLIEIKSPRQKEHVRTVLADEVPPQYVGQCQAALFVSGRSWCDFVSFCGGLPLYVKRVFPDPKWFKAIEAACAAFEKNAAELVDRFCDATKNLPKTERIDPFEVELKL